MMEIVPPRVNPWSDERLNAAADAIRAQDAEKGAARRVEIDAAIEALLKLKRPPDDEPPLTPAQDRHFRAVNAGIELAHHFGQRAGGHSGEKALSLQIDILSAMIALQAKRGAGAAAVEAVCAELRRRALHSTAVADLLKEARS